MSEFPHDATFEFAYDTTRRAQVVARSVAQETGEIGGDRSCADVSFSNSTVTVTVQSRDLVALRAGANTWLSLVDVAEQCAATADDEQ